MDESVSDFFMDTDRCQMQQQEDQQEQQLEESNDDDGVFCDLSNLVVEMLTVPKQQLSDEQLQQLISYLEQTTEAVQSGQVDEYQSGFDEIFEITSKTIFLCLEFDRLESCANILEQLKKVFYKNSELFSAAAGRCLNQKIPVSKFSEMFEMLKNCVKLDVKVFLQVTKLFVNLLVNGSATSHNFKSDLLIVFLQNVIIEEFLIKGKISMAALKITGFAFRLLTALYSNHLSTIDKETVRSSLSFLATVHGKALETFQQFDTNINTSFNTFVTQSFVPFLTKFLKHEASLELVLDMADVPDSHWLPLVCNIFTALIEMKIVTQVDCIEDILNIFIDRLTSWSLSEESSVKQWPIVSSKGQTLPYCSCAKTVASLVLASVLENMSSFFAWEQLLILKFTGKKECTDFGRVFISDVLSLMTKSSSKLAMRYVFLFLDLILKSSQQNDELSSILVPFLIRRIFNNIPDDEKPRLIESPLDEVTKNLPNSGDIRKNVSGVYSMGEAFKILEHCAQALNLGSIDKANVYNFFCSTIELFTCLVWWVVCSPEILKNIKSTLEKITMTMWSILAIIGGDDSMPQIVLILFALVLFDSSKIAIIGINSYEANAKFWMAANQFFDLATVPTAVRQLFILWLLKSVDSSMLGNCQDAQKILQKFLQQQPPSPGSKPGLLQCVILHSLSSRLNKHHFSTRLDPKLRLQAEAFGLHLFCIPFSNC